MSQNVVELISKFKTFKFDRNTKRIVNTKFQKETNIDEFLDIQFILRKNNMQFRFDKNFDIQIL